MKQEPIMNKLLAAGDRGHFHQACLFVCCLGQGHVIAVTVKLSWRSIHLYDMDVPT